MSSTITDLIDYTKYHFFEASVYQGSSFSYKLWAAKRIFNVLVNGRKKSETYLYPKDVTIKNNTGIFFVPAQTDLILNISSKTESNLLPYFSIQEGRIFLDIGANAGKWSIHIAKSSFSNQVVAFEPVPSTFGVIKKNIALNGLDAQVSLFNIGLSNQNSEITFALNSHFTGVNGVFHDSMISLPQGYEVKKIRVKKLDDVLAENQTDLPAIDLVKIDVEGHELQVIEGAQQTLKSLVPGSRMLVEIDDSSQSKQATLHLLGQLGFTEVKQLDRINFLLVKHSL